MNEKLDKLLSSNCVSINDKSSALNLSQIEELRTLVPSWQYCATENTVCQTFHFRSYRAAVDFVSQIANIAEQQDHHPEILLTYQRCKVSFCTHSVNGITMNDFICAAKIDALEHR